MDNNQTINLPDGLLVRTRDGKLKKVQSGRLVDLETKEIPEKEMPSIAPMSPQTQPPVAAGKKTEFYFDTEDEEEIEAHRDKLKDISEKPEAFDSDLVINNIIQKNNLSISDEILQKRFFNIIKSRLVNIRESVETEEALRRSTKVGGMGLDEATVAKIMIDADNEAAKIHDHETVKGLQAGVGIVSPRPEKPVSPARGAISTLEMPSPKPPKIPFSIPKQSVPTTAEMVKAPEQQPKPAWTPTPPPKPQELVEKKVQPTIPQQEVKIRVEQKEEAPVYQIGPRPTMPQVVRPVVESGRPQIVDIKKPIKVIGPVDELRWFTLKDFRRIGKTTLESVEKIKEKIGLLEEESFTLKTEGIKAWRNSEVNKLYLEMGRESIEIGLSIRDVINKKQSESKPCLTEGEFQAIADLNRQLNY